jgi:hypothetical protein
LASSLAAQGGKGFVKVISGAGFFGWVTLALYEGSNLVADGLGFFRNCKVDHVPPQEC